jgi:predicted AlkP superfamily pyrophosphatase or phosphodiesterase
MATDIGAPIMTNLVRGHVPGRSGDIITVPKPHHFMIGRWDLTTLGTDRPVTTNSHPNPWDYLARVPIVFYGPGFVPSNIARDEPTDIAAIAPTYACLLGMEGLDFEGERFEELCEAPGHRRSPKVIFSVVLDGGGWNVLEQHPQSHPTIDSLRKKGLTYTNATIGSAPTITGALHATMGTGVYPQTHGIPGNQLRTEDSRNVDSWDNNADPRFLRAPTISELWDERTDNRALVGTVSYEGWHLGMIGHGTLRAGGDEDVAVLWDRDDQAWWTNESYYKLPAHLRSTDLDRLSGYEDRLDERDGVADGSWFGHTPRELRDPRVRPGTPAFARFTGDAVIDIMREGLGDDRITDLFWVELKMPDYAGHAWNMLRPEQADVLSEVDRQIARFVGELDRTVGRRNYVLMVSADHGQEPLPETFGGWRIASGELEDDIEARFGPVVRKITTVEIYLEPETLERAEVDPVEIARWLGTYTVGDNIPSGAPGADRVPVARLDDTVFAGAFSASFIQSLTPDRIESFGDGLYPESRLYR